MRPEPHSDDTARDPSLTHESLIDRLGVAFFDFGYSLMISPLGAVILPLFAGKPKRAS